VKRQRADGTWTFTTVDWDAKWYWPIGTRVAAKTANGRAPGVVVKENSTSVRIRFDEERHAAAYGARLIPKNLLERAR
jgi:hypothetical protein